jgi:hypothetical protein
MPRRTALGRKKVHAIKAKKEVAAARKRRKAKAIRLTKAENTAK